MDNLKPLLIILFALLLISATTAVGTKLFTVNHKAQEYTWPVDTISDTEADTLLVGEIQSSNWYGLFAVEGDTLSGTQDIIVVAQASAWRTPTASQWKEIGRDTLDNPHELVHIDLLRMGAFSYRFILTGAGTQEVEYNAILVLKKD